MLGNMTGVLIDEFDFTGSYMGADIEITVPEIPVTPFGVTGLVTDPGPSSGKISLRGYYTGSAAGDVYKEMTDRLGTAGVGTCMAVLSDTTDANCVADCSSNAWGQTLKLSMPTKETLTFEAATAGTESIKSGFRILNATVTTTGNQAAVDFGAAGSLGGAVFIFVQTVGGSVSNASIKVQSATTEGGTYADEATVDVDAIGGYYAAMSGAVNRWLRVNVASMGGASSLKIVAIACVKGVTY
jgi:hypothetical protein